MILFVNLALALILVALIAVAAFRGRSVLTQGLREGVVDFLRLLPRIGLGVIGAGYIAEVIPHELVGAWLGPESGGVGVLLATIAGAVTPGGPVVGFSIGAAALKSGAAAPQVIAYSTAWALLAVQRLFVWELPLMPMRVVWLRAAVSIPLPFLAAAGAMLVGRP